MTPYDQAKHLYDDEENKLTFHEILSWHYQHGYVINCPEFFIMARVVPHRLPLKILANPTIPWTDGDCWWIHTFAGDMLKVFTWAPIKLPLVGWEKRNRPKIYDLNAIKTKIQNAHKTKVRQSYPSHQLS